MSNSLKNKLYLDKFSHLIAKSQDEHSPEINDLTTITEAYDSKKSYDVIFIHAYTTDDMNTYLKEFWSQEAIKVGGMIYFIYPKLNNPYYPGIHRDDIFPALGIDNGLGLYPGTHYKFNRMVSLNDVFTMIGVKYLNEKEIAKLQAPHLSSAPSGRVSDYVQYIPQISDRLKEKHPSLQTAFDQLTPGRQRQWARDIYSAKKQVTIDKRYAKLIRYLQEA